MPDLHVSAPQQEDASSLPPGQTSVILPPVTDVKSYNLTYTEVFVKNYFVCYLFNLLWRETKNNLFIYLFFLYHAVFCYRLILNSLQAKNGEALPPGPLPKTQRPPQTPSKQAPGGGEREEAEQKALLAVQCSLLKILSKTLATLQHFTPDCCQILLDQVSSDCHMLTFMLRLKCRRQ